MKMTFTVGWVGKEKKKSRIVPYSHLKNRYITNVEFAASLQSKLEDLGERSRFRMGGNMNI